MPNSERIQWAALALLAVAVVFTVAQGVWLQDRLSGLDRAVRNLERTVSPSSARPGAGAPVPPPPDPRKTPDAGSTIVPPPTAASRPEEIRAFRKAVRRATEANAIEQEYDIQLLNWQWTTFATENEVDAAQAAAIRPLFDDAEAKLRTLRERYAAMEPTPENLQSFHDERQRLSLEFYRRARPDLRPSQWYWIKLRLGGLDAPPEAVTILERWDWRQVAREAKLDESLRPAFEEAIRGLHETEEAGGERPDIVARMIAKEQEVRRALYEQIRSKLTAEQRDRLQGYFLYLDDQSGRPSVYLVDPSVPSTPPGFPPPPDLPPPPASTAPPDSDSPPR